MSEKRVITGKVKGLGNRKFKVEKGRNTEADITVEIPDSGDYTVEKLSIDDLPGEMPDGKTIVWFNNFAIKRDGQYIKQKYSVTIPGLGSTRPVIFDSNGKLFYYEGRVANDTIELTDGDPGIGKTT